MRPKLKVVPRGLEFVLDEVLEYDVPGLEFAEPPTVLDLGANIGAFAAFAMDRWPGAKVTCFEPHPANVRVLRENMAGLLVNVDDRVVLGGPTIGSYAVMTEGRNLACSTFQDTGVRGDSAICRTIHAELLGSCDVLKVDIEGAELEVLRHYKHLAGCSAVLVEVHYTAEREEIGRILTGAGLVLYHEKQPGAGCWVQRWLSKEMAAKVKPAAERAPHLFLSILGWKRSPFNAQSVERLVLTCAERGINVSHDANMVSGVDRARNISIEKARLTDYTHFMFIDSDIAFDPEQVLEMMSTGYDVVGGAYPKKGINWKAVAKAVRDGVPDDELPSHANDFVGNAAPGPGTGQVSPLGARYMEVEELGTGFLMIRRECIERYIDHWRDEIAYITDYEPRDIVHHMVFSCERDPACELEQAKRALLALPHGCSEADAGHAVSRYHRALMAGPACNGRYLTEDFSFCRRWKMMGGKVMLALDARLAHQGPFIFEGHLGLQYTQDKAEQ